MKLAEAYVDIVARTSKFGAALARVRRKLAAGLRRMTSSVRRWAPRIGIALAGAFTGAIFAATKFEQQMANVSTMLTETTMPAMKGFEKGIKRLAVQFGQSTQTLSKGLYDILSASIAARDGLGVLETASRAAIAGMTDTASAVDVITTVLNSYQLTARDATKVSDALFATVKAGKLTFADLARFLGMVAAPAAASGASMEGLFASIATLTRAGVRPRIAMTGMRQALMAFAKSTPDAIKAADAFGLSLSTNTLKTIGLVGVLEKLQGASTEQVAAMFSSVEAYNAIITLLGDMEGFVGDLDGQMKAAGSTMKAFNKMSNTMSFWLSRLKQQVFVLAADIGKMFIPALKDISKFILDNESKIKQFVLNTLGMWWNNTLNVIATLQHAFVNWGTTVELVMDTASFHIKQFVGDMKHFLVDDAKTWLHNSRQEIQHWADGIVATVGLLDTQVQEQRAAFGLWISEQELQSKQYAELAKRHAQEMLALEEMLAKMPTKQRKAKERELSAEEKADKQSIAERWADWNKGLTDRKRSYDKYRAKMINEEEQMWMLFFENMKGIWGNLLSLFQDNEKKKRDAIAETQAAGRKAQFIGLEDLFKSVALGALEVSAKVPKVGADAPEKIQKKQLTEQKKMVGLLESMVNGFEWIKTAMLSPSPLAR
ncbi:hypothetical protein LCGC14_0685940 [marine sediment metagenome]|uniref:Phage tail tape measure protein domain-containing protein n=1 Tax=marine sediment metagenome TaxID=412755 RepID=A0A0F9T832_9ZZZZ